MGGICLGIYHHDARVNSAALSTDGRFLATGSWDIAASLWAVITCAAVDESELAMAVGTNTTSPRRHQPQQTFRHDGRVNAVVLSMDALHLATASADFTARLWCARTGQCL